MILHLSVVEFEFETEMVMIGICRINFVKIRLLYTSSIDFGINSDIYLYSGSIDFGINFVKMLFWN